MKVSIALMPPFFVLLVATSLVAGEATGADPQPMVLLLRNGEVIDGKITRSGDRYDVAMPNAELHSRDGGQPGGVTGKSCSSLRRQHIEQGKVQEHLELGEWCIKNKLWTEAQSELADATEADAMHPKIALLQRRLDLALKPPVAKPAHVVSPTTTVANQPSTDELDKLVCFRPAAWKCSPTRCSRCY